MSARLLPTRWSLLPFLAVGRNFCSASQVFERRKLNVGLNHWACLVIWKSLLSALLTFVAAGNTKQLWSRKNSVFLRTYIFMERRRQRMCVGLAPEYVMAAGSGMLRSALLLTRGWFSHTVLCPHAHVMTACLPKWEYKVVLQVVSLSLKWYHFDCKWQHFDCKWYHLGL